MPQPSSPHLQGTGARPYGQIRIPGGLVISVFRASGGRLYTDDLRVSGPFHSSRYLLFAIGRRLGCKVQLEVTQDGAPSPALPEDPQTQPQPQPQPLPSENLVASVAESASALTLQEPDDVSSSDVLPDYTSSEEESSTDSDDSTDDSLPSAFPLGSEILIRDPPKWYQMYFIRIDSSGYFHMYPDLGGPFQSLDQADSAISHHLATLQPPSLLKEQHYSNVERLIHEHNYYPDGTPKRGPNSRRRTHPNEKENYLVQALLDQYNDNKNLFGNLALELGSLLRHKLIHGKKRLYYHFNFTTKTGNLFFAEVSEIQGGGAWKVTCCCMIDSNENGQCNSCRNDMKHPNNTDAYTAGCLNGYWQYGEGERSESDDDVLETEAARLRVALKCLDDTDAMKRIFLRAMQKPSSNGLGAQV